MSTTADVLGALGIPELEASGLVTASHDQPSYLAFQHLANQRVCSALVWNPASSTWAGFLDLGDYAKHLGACRQPGRGWQSRSGVMAWRPCQLVPPLAYRFVD